MESKNLNYGLITAENGNIQIGDNTFLNVIDGLGILLADYKQQLDTIEQLINEFKVNTALGLLSKLEERVKGYNLPNRDIIISKVYYLKASCKRQINDFSLESSASDFIQAYKRNLADTSFRERACVEYLNIHESEKALILADEILAVDEFNRTAWYVKAICAENLKSFLAFIPKIVFEEYNFQMTMVTHVIEKFDLHFLEDIADFSLRAEIAFEKYTDLKFSALDAWKQAIYLSVNKFFNKFPIQYIHGDKFIFKDNDVLEPAFALVEKYVTALENTEISTLINHERFFYAYLGYLKTNDVHFFKIVEATFPDVDDKSWIYTFCFCQLLNHQKKYDRSLQLINAYLNSGQDIRSEAYLIKSTLLHLIGRVDLIEQVFVSYLSSINIIEERNGFNILSVFLKVLHGRVSKTVIEAQIQDIYQKEFKNDALKSLLNIALTVRCIEVFDKDEVFERLMILTKFTGFDNNWKNLVAENLNAVGKRQEAILFLETYTDKKIISESLRLYIHFLYEQLTDKHHEGDSRSDEVLSLLKFWREHCKYANREFILFEHNLYTELNDLESLEEIDGILHQEYPDEEEFILIYLNVLERGGKLNKIKEVATNIKDEFIDENFGVNVSIILIRSGADKKKGFAILSRLAYDRNNTVARRNYFILSLSFKDLFEAYSTVSKGNWVSYRVEDRIEVVKVERESGLQKQLIGKKVNESFTIVAGASGRDIQIEILEILNDAFHLLRDIQEEISNPANDLGFESLQMPSDTTEFIQFLKSNFGSQGSDEKKHVNKLLDDYFNYRIGLTEVTSAVFKKSYIDAYLHLTRTIGNKFTTLPSRVTKLVNPENADITFAIDFSTVLLFYFLEKTLDFKFIHKYTISFYIKDEIQRELMLIDTTPVSRMTVSITSQSVNRYEIPEDFNERRREFLESLLEWIDKNCSVDLVQEKLNLLAKFSQGERLEEFMKIMVDYMCLCDRPNHQVITSDSSLFLFTRRNNTIGNIVNPEKYLKAFYPEKCDSTFYRYLFQNNYLGIGITLDTLKNEFYQMLAGGQTYYYACLENLQFMIHGNDSIIQVLSKFLKDLYLMKSLTIESKNTYAESLLSNAVVGMPRETIILLSNCLQDEFRLLGMLSDELKNTFLRVVNK